MARFPIGTIKVTGLKSDCAADQQGEMHRLGLHDKRCVRINPGESLISRTTIRAFEIGVTYNTEDMLGPVTGKFDCRYAIPGSRLVNELNDSLLLGDEMLGSGTSIIGFEGVKVVYDADAMYYAIRAYYIVDGSRHELSIATNLTTDSTETVITDAYMLIDAYGDNPVLASGSADMLRQSAMYSKMADVARAVKVADHRIEGSALLNRHGIYGVSGALTLASSGKPVYAFSVAVYIPKGWDGTRFTVPFHASPVNAGEYGMELFEADAYITIKDFDIDSVHVDNVEEGHLNIRLDNVHCVPFE